VLDEPLEESALVARAIAADRCGPDCRAYHGTLQLLRLLGIIATPSRDLDFYTEAARDALPAGRRVLISSAADYNMLATTMAACAAAGFEPTAVTVLDRCPTPVALSAWWAARRSLDVAAAVGDITTFTTVEPYDLITTDSLFTLLPPDAREQAVVRWHDALSMQGVVATAMRIQPGGRPEVPDAAKGDAFVAVVRDAVARDGTPAGVAVDALLEDARAFALTWRTWPFGSVDEVRDLFERGGLRVERLDEHQAAGPTTAVASAARAATYARDVARRR
jgi:hypothetical protein